jgi:pimeloyl-ACP methyl ester carboxylesterase
MSTDVTPFHLSIPEEALTELRERLTRTRLPSAETVTDTSQGPKLAAMENLKKHWVEQYDWRRCESLLNGFGQSKTEIDGLPIHLLHLRSQEPHALPLLLTHGWPGSVLEFRKVIEPLVDPVEYGGSAEDAFNVIIPSLPGFGFSGQPCEAGWDIGRIASAWATLMDRLGYKKWGAQGGDWGAAVTLLLGHMAPAGLAGIHLNFVMYQPTEEEMANADADEQAMMASAQNYQQRLAGYAQVQGTRPQAVAYALSDSPLGQAAWIYSLFQDVADCNGDPTSVFSMDEMLDDIMLYWLPNASASSARLYWNSMSAMMSGPPPFYPSTMPTGISMFPKEQVRISKRWAQARFKKLVHYKQAPAGGHFAALEQPKEFVEGVRETFRSLRS